MLIVRALPHATASLLLLTALAGESAAAADVLRPSSVLVREGGANGYRVGSSVSAAGDVNGDGFSDILVNSQENNGTVQCYHGRLGLLAYGSANWTVSGGAQSWLDARVSTAGDVNGDGYDDVLIGAPHYANGQVEEGAVYVYLGSPSGLGVTPQIVLEGDRSNERFATALDTAGDVNGDGFADIVVGVPDYDNDNDVEGRAIVYFGSAEGIVPSPGWTFESDVAGANFGTRVCGGVDLNADGYDDLVVSAPELSHPQFHEGRIYLFLGSPSGPAVAPSWTYESNAAQGRSGLGLGATGDLNADGFGDLAFDVSAGSLAGILAFLGGEGVPGVIPDRRVPLSRAGFADALFTAGDVNGDGCADLIAGEPSRNTWTGEITIWGGSETATDLPFLASRAGTQNDERFGTEVRSAGDVNGDGFGDVIVGAPGYDNGSIDEGQVEIYLGCGGPPTEVWSYYRQGDQQQANYGWCVAQGDWNSDGFTDLAVGSPDYDMAGANSGAVSIYYGGEAGYATNPDRFLTGAQVGARFGYALADAGDVDNDGYCDLLVGAPNSENVTLVEAGTVYLYPGSPDGLSSSPSWVIAGTAAHAHLGFAVAGAGDANGDGFADVAVGAPDFSSPPIFGGQVFLYLGSESGLNTTSAWSARGGSLGDRFGFSLAGAGDVDGDGLSDLIVGAPYEDNGQTDEGVVHVYFGAPGGMEGGWTTELDQAGAGYGWRVATAGDVNGDALSDLLASAPFYDANGVIDRGSAIAYLGSTSRSFFSTWIQWGGATGDVLGAGLGGGGDVDNDGLGDVIVGAPGQDPNGQDNAGRVYLYYGNRFGVDAEPAWTTFYQLPEGQYGMVVSIDGDVTGDGFADVCVGQPYWVDGRGLTWFYYGARHNLPPDGNASLRLPRQLCADGTTPVALLGASDHWNSFLLGSIGRSARGRSKVEMEFEVASAGASWSGATQSAGVFDTGVPISGWGSAVGVTATAAGLDPASPHRWRMRSKGDSPYFPRSPWCSIPGNTQAEMDVRTAAGDGEADVPGVGSPGQATSEAPRIDGIEPNPCAGEAIVRLAFYRAGEARVTVHEAAGRRVATLLDGPVVAGRRSLRWTAHDDQGRPLASGVYLIRLDVAGRQASTKVTLQR